MENKRSQNKSMGGQAVIEGVMMRAPGKYAVAVRKPNGRIALRIRDISIDHNKWFKKPVLRGIIMLYDAIVVGFNALNFSAEQSSGEELEPLGGIAKTLTIFAAIAISIGLFVFAPLAAAKGSFWLLNLDLNTHYVLFNALDGFVRILIFIGYIVAISMMSDIRELFRYHGAEHKAIFTYEMGKELTLENTRNNSRFHPRCGTSFLLIVLIISIIVFSFIPSDAHFIIHFLGRIVLVPLIAGISFEALKLSGVYRNNIFVRIIIAPGLWLQRLTTKEPNDGMIEVALIAVRASLGEDMTKHPLVDVEGAETPVADAEGNADADPDHDPDADHDHDADHDDADADADADHDHGNGNGDDDDDSNDNISNTTTKLGDKGV